MRKFILAALAALALHVGAALAGTTGTNFVTPQTPQSYTPQQIVNATGTSFKTIVTGNNSGAAAGSKITSILVTNTDTTVTAGHVVTCAEKVSATDYTMMTFIIQPGAGGNATILPVQLISQAYGFPLDSDGNPYLFLGPGVIFECEAAVAVTNTAGMAITFIPFGADF